MISPRARATAMLGVLPVGLLRPTLVLQALVLHGLVLHGLVLHALVLHALVLHGLVLHGLVLHGLVLHGLVLRGLVPLGLVLLAACDARPDRARPAAPAMDLTGAGATFPYPLFTRWISRYSATTGVRVNYRSVGSDAGLRELAAGSVDFSATEAPLSDAELASLPGGPVLQLPVAAGAVAVAYNLPDVTAPLRLTGELLADIFLGRISRWNDRRLRAVNPGAALPPHPIRVVNRADGSGTTLVTTEYLARVSSRWAAGPGVGVLLRWPVGVGARGNEGVAGQVKQAPYSIGFVELAYARQNRLPVASMRNRRGIFVPPSAAAVAAATDEALRTLTEAGDLRVSLVNVDGDAAYPICSYTWLVVPQVQPDSVKRQALVAFIRWAIAEGGADAPPLDYAPLPAPLARRVGQVLSGLAAPPGG